MHLWANCCDMKHFVTICLIFGSKLLSPANSLSISQIQAGNYSIQPIANWSQNGGVMKLKGNKNTWTLLDLNSLIQPSFQGQDMRRIVKLYAQFYITKLPEKGALYQAFRATPCVNGTLGTFPLSCSFCCGKEFSTSVYDLPGISEEELLTREYVVSIPHCCSKLSDAGNRNFMVGEKIAAAPSKVTIAESGFVWFLPQVGDVGLPYTQFEFRVEYWRADVAPLSTATSSDSGCEEDRKKCQKDRYWCTNNTELIAKMKVDNSCCGRCTSSLKNYTVNVDVVSIQQYPQVGFGGHMIAFDGGDDFMVTEFARMPSYEFGLQFWFQQSKLSPGQTLLTWWTDTRGREFEIADTSNLYFFHMNNRSQKTGVALNDGKWHHVCFSFRLTCSESSRIQGGKYCIQPYCNIEHDCLHFEIAIIVDGQYRATAFLPAFILSSQGKMVWGQRVLKSYRSVEQVYKSTLFRRLQDEGPTITSNIEVEFTDRELELIYGRIRSKYMNDTILFGNVKSMDSTGWVFTEDEPWRDPHFKYCEAVAGDFDPFAALSGNIDEVRFYSYFRDPSDVILDMHFTLSGDNFYTYSSPEANVSLILYLNFDLDNSHFLARSRGLIQAWPLDLEDQALPSVDLSIPPSVTTLGDGVFKWAPLQVPSTAPLRGSRIIQISIPNNEEPIPINLADIAVEEDRTQYMIYSRIDVGPAYGDLRAAADDCDNITKVDQGGSSDASIYFRSEPACTGGVLNLFLVGGISASTLTSNCSIGDKITAVDGFGTGFLAEISAVSSVGAIQGMQVIQFGSGYDWINTSRTDLIVGNGTCACGGAPGNVRGNMRACMRALIGSGKADTSGKDFAGVDLSGTSLTYDYGPTSCNNGLCPAVKPRPCAWACHRTLGWMTDLVIAPTNAPAYNKFMAGPYSEFSQSTQQFIRGFEPVYWSNRRHTVWYVPTVFGGEGSQDDQFLVRKFNSFPKLEIFAKDMQPPPPRPHAWIHITREKLTIPLNTSRIWEANSAMVIQLQFIDFDRGINILNSPFEVFVDPPSRGTLYQAIQMNRSDPNFKRDCICMNAPRFPPLRRQPDVLYYPKDQLLSGSVQCDVDDIGQFCMKKGEPVSKNDTLVTQYEDTIFIPGFQRTRHGYHMIYYMGDDESGAASFDWRIRHPQGQMQNASVYIEVRRSNSPPVALNRTFESIEDTVCEIKLDAIDVDDYEKPTMFITQYPSHGDLYQCKNSRSNSSCEIGEQISSFNDTIIQWAATEEDDSGAIDDANSKVWRIILPQNSKLENDGFVAVDPNASQTLHGGYGFSSWHFDPDLPQSFRRMCGDRGTFAAKLTTEIPVFVTSIEIFASLRFDTPFRLLAKAPHPLKAVLHDYNRKMDDTLESLPIASSFLYKNDSNQDAQTQSAAISEQYVLYCGSDSAPPLTSCQSRWNDSRLSKGQYYEFSANSDVDWIELYRGLPPSTQASKDRFSPVFTPGRYHASEYRIEACGGNGRVFDKSGESFLQNGLVRISGSRVVRPKGMINSGNFRLVYVPYHNWNGEDSFAYAVLDHAGAANRSSPRFSMGRAWSPAAFVNIVVKPKPDKPESKNSVTDIPFSDGAQTVIIPVDGFQVGPSGADRISTFEVQIVEGPHRGQLLDLTGLALAPRSVTKAVLFHAPADVCGFPFAFFTYFVQNTSSVESLPSEPSHASINIGCRLGFMCNQHDMLCKPCDLGSYGRRAELFNTCFLCAAGKYQDKHGATSCETCIPGSFASITGATTCDLCPTGTISTKYGESFCSSCPGGMFAPLEGTTACIECGNGAYTKTAGSTACTDCPNNTWTRTRTAGALAECECVANFYVLGSSGMPCLPCPYGAYCHGRSLFPIPKTGYWTSKSLWTQPSRTQEGDSRWSSLNVSGVAVFLPCSYRYIRGVCIGYPDVDVQEAEEFCQYRNGVILQGPSSLDTLTSEAINERIRVCTLLLPHEVPAHGPDSALRPWKERQNYSSNYYCAEGYEDIICSKCAGGYTRSLSGFCSKCSILFTVPFINLCYFVAVIGFQVVGWFCMFLAIAYRARSFHLFVTHLQLLAVLSRLSIPWPKVAQSPLNLCSWFNLNFDGLNWNCIGLNLESSTQRWILDILTPWAVIFGISGYFLWTLQKANAITRAAKSQAAERVGAEKALTQNKIFSESESAGVRESITGLVEATERALSNGSQSEIQHVSTISQVDASKSEAPKESSSDSEDSTDSLSANMASKEANAKRVGGLETRTGRDTILPLTPEEIRNIEDSAIANVVLTVNILYVMAMLAILVPLSCSKVTDDFTYLDWNPTFMCQTNDHIKMQLLAAALALIWVFVVPLTLVFVIWKAWQMELIRDKQFAHRFGWLFDCYEVKYCWWEISVLVRKLVLVSGQGLFMHNAYLQLLTICSYSAIHLCLTFYCQPYIHRRHTILDIWLQIQFLLVAIYAFTNIAGKDGFRVVNTLFGLFNENVREGILAPYPNMESVADKMINASIFLSFIFVALILFTTSVALLMLVFDVYELRPKAPRWAPFLYNAVTGFPLHRWRHDSSKVIASVDNIIGLIRDRNKQIPPVRPPSRWAHRIMEQDGEARAEDFWDSKTLNDMIEDVIAATQELEWPKSRETVLEYIRSLDRRIFAAELYYSKAPNLAPLERERNNAKKVLLKYMQSEAEEVFRKLYNQTGHNERLLAEIAEFKRREQHIRVLIAGKVEEKKYIELEHQEQERRIVEAERWRSAYEEEKKHSQELLRKVKQARDAAVLYHLEESSSSEDEKQIDNFLKQKVDEYIETKTAKEMMEDGKMEPIPRL